MIQVIGTPMGSDPSLFFANLFLAHKEDIFLHAFLYICKSSCFIHIFIYFLFLHVSSLFCLIVSLLKFLLDVTL